MTLMKLIEKYEKEVIALEEAARNFELEDDPQEAGGAALEAGCYAEILEDLKELSKKEEVTTCDEVVLSPLALEILEDLRELYRGKVEDLAVALDRLAETQHRNREALGEE